MTDDDHDYRHHDDDDDDGLTRRWTMTMSVTTSACYYHETKTVIVFMTLRESNTELQKQARKRAPRRPKLSSLVQRIREVAKALFVARLLVGADLRPMLWVRWSFSQWDN